MGLFSKLFGTSSEKALKELYPIVDKIEAMEQQFSGLSDKELKDYTPMLRSKLENGATLDDILPEAFAACREASRRVLGMFPYRVQLIGGIILHQGRIAEMRTGEGKTLVATLPSYLNALGGEGVHVITVNDYLARRDSEEMGKIHRFMGLTVGLAVHGVDDKKSAYAADITYATNNELGFDYLRDNMVTYEKDVCQRGHAFAIVDEVDSILIDEARTPLIISGQGEKSTKLYAMVNSFVSRLVCQKIASVDNKEEEDENIKADYIVDEKARSATLTARGISTAERAFNIENLGDLEHATLAHHINQAIKAHGVMARDIDYVVKDGEVVIVDENTGRLMDGRRYNEGLHQAIEAKEKVKIANESKTLATITFQNYFRLYDKLSGMTGTAMTEEEEFGQIYKLDIVEVPTNRPIQRIDQDDVVYKTERAKLQAVVEQIKVCNEKGQPVLVGTVSIEKSEEISKHLKKAKITHQVLNAKNHENEAAIVAQAGKFSSVTVATNMAGRGTDIVLGGNAGFMAKEKLRKTGMSDMLLEECTSFSDTDNQEILDARKAYQELEAAFKKENQAEAEKVRKAGGLYILGTERHESRRIDNQLRGRSGRQGDPGESRFFLSLDDDIMRLFGTERVRNLMDKMGVDDDVPIEQKMLTNSIERAQKQVESRNFQQRKNVLEYDDVMNIQRQVIYEQRNQVLKGVDLKERIFLNMEEMIGSTVIGHVEEDGSMSKGEYDLCVAPFRVMFLGEDDLNLTEAELKGMKEGEITEKIVNFAKDFYNKKEEAFSETTMREVERVVTLKVVDEFWMDQIDAMSDLRQGIGLRGYAQVNPVVAYKEEGHAMFSGMVTSIKEETLRRLFVMRLKSQEDIKREMVAKITAQSGGSDTGSQPVQRRVVKIGRNDPCPCGSGEKWKKCTCEKFHKNLTPLK